jgi:hypothetical protein
MDVERKLRGFYGKAQRGGGSLRVTNWDESYLCGGALGANDCQVRFSMGLSRIGTLELRATSGKLGANSSQL